VERKPEGMHSYPNTGPGPGFYTDKMEEKSKTSGIDKRSPTMKVPNFSNSTLLKLALLESKKFFFANLYR